MQLISIYNRKLIKQKVNNDNNQNTHWCQQDTCRKQAQYQQAVPKYWFISTKLLLNSGSVPFKLVAEKAWKRSERGVDVIVVKGHWCQSEKKTTFGTSGITKTFFWSRLRSWECITPGGKISELLIYFWFNKKTFFMSPWRHFPARRGEMCFEWATLKKKQKNKAQTHSVCQFSLFNKATISCQSCEKESEWQPGTASLFLSLRLWFLRWDCGEIHNSSVGLGLCSLKGKMEEFRWWVMKV